MKIDKFFERFPTDGSNPGTSELNDALRWMRKEIDESYENIWDSLKRLFYKEQQLDAFYKYHANDFNSVCRSNIIFDAYNMGMFSEDNLNTDETKARIKEIAANFFPSWMWKNIEFYEITREEYECRYLDISFIWTAKFGRKKKEIEFRIDVPNPSAIEEGKVFKLLDAYGDFIKLNRDRRYHKTMVYVNTDVRRNDECKVAQYNFIVSSYMNNEIRDAIDNWAKGYGQKDKSE